ncbi:MAG: L,D-transpeptidase family protein, partial [Bacteroidetes bacterium]|nr:L,D-transpeptidase family protein [Bacteroidota bacterium]
ASANSIPKASKVIMGNFNPASGINIDSAAIIDFIADKPLFKEFEDDFIAVYQNTDFNYLWYDKKGLIVTANALIANLGRTDEEGVITSVPYKTQLDSLLETTNPEKYKKPDINMELMLTGEYFYYAKNIWKGSLISKADSVGWYVPKKKLSYSNLLEDNLSKGVLSETDVKIIRIQYDGLKKGLAHYRDIEKRGNEIVLPALKKRTIIHVGDSSELISQLKERLNQLGNLKENKTEGKADANVIVALMDFKNTHGLNADSIVDSETIQELNVSAKKRVEQIMVNMERCRWLPAQNNTDEFIVVNIPEYKLVYYQNDSVVLRSNVVVGKPMTKTVIFSGNISYIVFSPYWYVPQSIIRNEVVPGMNRNSNYLAKHNMEWNGGNVRQKPGASNSLGLVKFIFPNSNNIYLHDTPAKSLFGESSRAFSHGCIRVAKPEELANRILVQAPEWTPEKIHAAMHAGKERKVVLKKKIPVYICYFTSFIGANGELNFRPDIYKRDEQLLNMMMETSEL